MISQRQRDWLCDKCDALLITAGDYKLPDETSDLIVQMANKYLSQANSNELVKKGLMLTIDYIDSMYKLMHNG